MSWRIAIWTAAALFGALFAAQGGMVSTSEYFELRGDVLDLRDSVGVMREAVVRERARLRALEHDPLTQEREARQRYGALRNGERLYVVIPDVPAPTR